MNWWWGWGWKEIMAQTIIFWGNFIQEGGSEGRQTSILELLLV